jgi:hypothetical protein
MKSISRAALALAATAVLAGGLPATAAHARTTCSIQPYGLIGNYWQSLGGAGGPLGCATTTEYSLPNQNGRKQRFQGGQVAWSPDQGPNMIVAAYKVNGHAVFRWGPSTPFNYDYWHIAWKQNPVVISDIRYPNADTVNAPRTSGRFVVYPPSNVTNSNGYATTVTFWVMGCDDHITGDTCRQGYTLPVSTNV